MASAIRSFSAYQSNICDEYSFGSSIMIEFAKIDLLSSSVVASTLSVFDGGFRYITVGCSGRGTCCR